MAFKFEGLEVWQLAMEYVDVVYELGEKLPHSEDFNLKSHLPQIIKNRKHQRKICSVSHR